MRRILLVGTAFLGIAASGLAARAVPIDFTYTGSLVTFTVPATGPYQILAFGAQGGNSGIFEGLSGPGGLGAEIGGDFNLTAGEVLQIAVGGMGMSFLGAGAGGGGSFVVGPGNMPLVIAGGGGGAGLAVIVGGITGGAGLAGPDGGGQGGGTGGSGGGGAGGSNTLAGGGGGGGFFTAGGDVIFEGTLVAGGGGAFPGLAGGFGGGGFGGGGGAEGVLPTGGGGGGGGYSGGGGAPGELLEGDPPGGGGGSFDAGIDQILVADFQTGDGEVVITGLIPEPASITLLGAGLVGLAVVWRRRRRSR